MIVQPLTAGIFFLLEHLNILSYFHSLVLSVLIFLEKKMDWLREVALAGWDVLVASAPYMLLGFFIAGLLKAFLPDDLVARHLGKSSFTGLIKAAALGVPIPLCSCGVLPAAAGLRRQGAGKGPTTAFLISTPETGVDSMAVTWALLDPFMTIVRPFSAFVTALVTWTMVQTLDRNKEPNAQQTSPAVPLMPSSSTWNASCQGGVACGCNPASAETSPRKRLRAGLNFAFGELFRDIAPWFLVGVFIAGAISVWITPEMVSTWLGRPFVAMLAMLAVSVPLYVCASASTPIAAALVLKGLNPGAALVFLLAGPATNAASLAVIGRIMGRRAAVIYVAGIMVCSLAMGLLVDWVYARPDFFVGGLEGWRIGAVKEQGGHVGVGSAMALLALFAWKWAERLLASWGKS
jgi:uncharacterized protein